MKILNLTQHEPTDEQVDAGVVMPADHKKVKELLTFHELPTRRDIERVAIALAEIAKKSGCNHAMIGGAPYLMSTLEAALLDAGITPLYAFSQRVVTEVTEGGETRKVAVFRHLGFVKV